MVLKKKLKGIIVGTPLETVARALVERAFTSSEKYGKDQEAKQLFGLIQTTNTVFIHIPKSAGVSISQTIYGAQIGHLKWFNIQSWDPLVYENALKLTVCRNPLNRFCSAFRFLSAGGINEKDAAFAEQILGGCGDINEFVSSLKDEDYRRQVMGKVHFQPQHPFFCSEDGVVKVNYVLRFEHLQEELANLMPVFHDRALPHLNQYEGPSQTNLTADSEALLREIYKEDIEILGRLPRQKDLYGFVVAPTT